MVKPAAKTSKYMVAKKYELSDGVQILIYKKQTTHRVLGLHSARKCNVSLATAARADRFF